MSGGTFAVLGLTLFTRTPGGLGRRSLPDLARMVERNKVAMVGDTADLRLCDAAPASIVQHVLLRGREGFGVAPLRNEPQRLLLFGLDILRR